VRTATAWWAWGARPARVDADAAGLIADLESRWKNELILPREPTLTRSDEQLVARLRDRLGEDAVRDDDATRARHAIGQSYRELAEAQRGIVPDPPMAVVTARSQQHVATALAECKSMGLAVVPFGGGTSVTGGVKGPAAPHIAISLRGLATLRSVDPVSLVATADAGMLGPELEAALAPHRLTLGHYPQSFERSTVGGWIATRSAGQFSTGVGAIADLVVGLRAVAPRGEIVIPAMPPSAEGPDLLQAIVGSEGRYGVITEASLRVRPAAERTAGAAWLFPSFAEGALVVRSLLQVGPAPALVRLSDEAETRALARTDGALLLVGASGAAADVSATLEAVGRAIGARGKAIGVAAYERWYATRYDAPYLRDALLERGMIADSLETSTLWTDLSAVHVAVRDALGRALDADGRAVVLCHLSHAYPTGASLYFTFIGPGGEDRVERWWAAKRAALDVMLANGATVSHHHGIGRDHRQWQARRLGETGMRAIDAVARELDPDRVLAANR
jgi:alkyldihydroxyacetonephosphate synthase